MFLAILGFIGIGLILLIGLFMLATFSMATSIYPLSGVSVFLIYLLLAVVYFFPVYFLFQFSANMKKGVEMRSAEYTELALKFQKMMYKYMGIVTIVVMCVYPFIIAGIIISTLKGM